MKKKNVLIVIVCVLLLLPVLLYLNGHKQAGNEPAVEQEDTIFVKSEINLKNLSKFGNIVVPLRKADMFELGFEPGDIVTVSFLDKKNRSADRYCLYRHRFAESSAFL